jgi:hypothetical protein
MPTCAAGNDNPPVTLSTLFDMASITKILGATTASALLVQVRRTNTTALHDSCLDICYFPIVNSLYQHICACSGATWTLTRWYQTQVCWEPLTLKTERAPYASLIAYCTRQATHPIPLLVMSTRPSVLCPVRGKLQRNLVFSLQ